MFRSDVPGYSRVSEEVDRTVVIKDTFGYLIQDRNGHYNFFIFSFYFEYLQLILLPCPLKYTLLEPTLLHYRINWVQIEIFYP